MRKFLTVLALLMPLVWICSCSDLKSTPVTWEDIASTIPANPKYVVSVNTNLQADSALNDIWAQKDVISLLSTGLALDSVKPSHFVVVSLDKVSYITWPVPNPERVAEKVSKWTETSLNNTVDAHILVRGNASLVLSSTQIWVVNSTHGDDYVNDILSSAMNTKAANSPVLKDCICSSPEGVRAVIPYNDCYYSVELNQEEGLMRVDVDAYDKNGNRLDIVSGLGRLKQDFVDEISAVSPFVAVAVERGSMPELIKEAAKFSDNPTAKLGAAVIAPTFKDVEGTVIARWNNDEIEVTLPYVSKESAETAEKKIKSLLTKSGYHLDVSRNDSVVRIATPFTSGLPELSRDRSTPHMHTQTSNPSAVAFARFEIDNRLPAKTYVELAPQHARLQIDFEESRANVAAVFAFVKSLVLRVL